MSVNAWGSQWLLEDPSYCCTQHVNTPVDGSTSRRRSAVIMPTTPGEKLHAIVADLPTLG